MRFDIGQSGRNKGDQKALMLIGGVVLAMLALSSNKKKAGAASTSSDATPDVPPTLTPSTSTPSAKPSTKPSTPAPAQERGDVDAADAAEIAEAVRKAKEAEEAAAKGGTTTKPKTPSKPPAASSTGPAKSSTTQTEPDSSRALATSLAQRLAAEVKAKKYDYDRQLCRNFQAVATGLAVDGVYGGATYNALKFYGIAKPPSALFKPSPSAAPYQPAA